MSELSTRRLTRRTLLTVTGGAAAAAVAGSALSGCTRSTSGRDGSGPAVALPSQVPFNGPPADLPGDPAKGINPGYLSYPTDLVRTVEGKVGNGGAFSAFVISFSPPPPPLASNTYWKKINEVLGVELKPTLVPQEFPTKLAAMLASGDVPDLVTMYLNDAQSVRRFEAVAQSKFADLSDHLSGDAVKEYPNLARFSSNAWPATLVGGRIYATPTLRIPTGTVLYQRAELIKAAGANPNPGSAAEFEELCKALTNPAQKRWALSNGSTLWCANTFYSMFGVPYEWRRNSDGTLTRSYETAEWEQAIAFMAKLFKAGYWHPNSATDSGADVDPLFENGTVAMRQDSLVRYSIRGPREFTPAIMKPLAAAGGNPIMYESSPTDFVTFVKKGDSERVKESLRILNWLNAPFGSEENFLRTFGVEGKDHTLEGGQPRLTDTGTSEVQSLCLRFIGGGPDVLYAANGNSTMIKPMHQFQTEVSPLRLTNPVTGLYSEAAATTGGVDQQVTDTVNDVVVGRKPVTALKEAVTAWKQNGGDKIRADYEKALAAPR